jgi:hypothetical protein
VVTSRSSRPGLSLCQRPLWAVTRPVSKIRLGPQGPQLAQGCGPLWTPFGALVPLGLTGVERGADIEDSLNEVCF